MCGILAAQYSKTSSLNLPQALVSMKHRGPDQTGLYSDKNHNTYIGHNRLAINGGKIATQPMLSDNTPWIISVNGEIYNDREKLKAKGAVFQTNSDSEYVLKGIELFGISFVASLDGEFSLCTYNRESNRLYLARDRNGSKPLYYYHNDDYFIAASEIKALLSAGVPAVWNKHYLVAKERFLVGAKETFVKGVFSVPPGHIVEHTNNELKSYPFCEQSPFNPDLFEPCDISYEQATQEFSQQFEQAVNKRIPQERFACYLSSGIDSSYISALSARLSDKAESFSIGFPNNPLDESLAAEKFAKQIGIKHHTLPLEHNDLIGSFEKSIYHAESIVPNLNVAAKYLLSRKVKESGIRIALTGEGADESLLGYQFFQYDLSSPLTQQSGPTPLFEGQATLETALNFTPSATISAKSNAQLFKSLRSADFSEACYTTHLVAPHSDIVTSSIGYSQWLHYNTVYQDYNLLALGDKTELANSIEGRQPFLDNSLVAFIHSLPTAFKYYNGKNKRILRDAFTVNFPHLHVEQIKKPFLAPTNLTKNITLYLLDELHELSNRESQLGIYDIDKVIAFFESVVKNQTQLDFSEDIVVCHFLSILFLQKHFNLEA
ncbi:asparagine synthase (glutamine-hydrolyzing) [Pseudoalteromonas sp. R3]|uniref:asparagine synthase (glutamine-hydrolyzing) n=1 Tax=Pseudoalteromonas sp. R3 TaxID=1709477 RepID=UPI0009EB3D78|nr:asparagine synthase (glutamine-hydrolyzing) [Pseudoalteromonas sp. R3]